MKTFIQETITFIILAAILFTMAVLESQRDDLARRNLVLQAETDRVTEQLKRADLELKACHDTVIVRESKPEEVKNGGTSGYHF